MVWWHFFLLFLTWYAWPCLVRFCPAGNTMRQSPIAIVSYSVWDHSMTSRRFFVVRDWRWSTELNTRNLLYYVTFWTSPRPLPPLVRDVIYECSLLAKKTAIGWEKRPRPRIMSGWGVVWLKFNQINVYCRAIRLNPSRTSLCLNFCFPCTGSGQYRDR